MYLCLRQKAGRYLSLHPQHGSPQRQEEGGYLCSAYSRFYGPVADHFICVLLTRYRTYGN